MPTRPTTADGAHAPGNAYGYASWLAGDTATSIRLLEEAVDLLDGAPPSTDEARVLAGLAGNLMLAGRCAESIPFAERAIESARAVGAQVIESRALNILGVDRANLGSIAAGIDLLRQSVAIALIVDDPIELPRSYANLGSMLEVGGFVEEALETSLAGAESTGRYGGELSFRWLLETNAALMLIELARYPEAAVPARAERPARPAGRQHHPPLQHVRPSRSCGPGTLRPPAAISSSPATRRATSRTLSSPSSSDTVGTEIALWSGDAAAAFEIAREGLDRLLEHGRRDPARAAGDARDACRCRHRGPSPHGARPGRGQGRRRRRTRGGRPLSSRRWIGCRSGTNLPSMSSAGGMAICTAELARAAGEDDPAAWEAIRPAVAARPAPFLEAYVAVASGRGVGRAGRPRRGRRAPARRPCDRGGDRRVASSGPRSRAWVGACASTSSSPADASAAHAGSAELETDYVHEPAGARR